MSDSDTSSPTTTTTTVGGGGIFGDYTLNQQHTGSEVNTDTATSRETDSDYTDPPLPLALPPIVTNDLVYSRIPMPVTGSRRSYIAPRETEYRYSDDVNSEDEDDEAASIRAEEVRERFRKGVRRVICVLRMMKEMPGETWRKSLGETW